MDPNRRCKGRKEGASSLTSSAFTCASCFWDTSPDTCDELSSFEFYGHKMFALSSDWQRVDYNIITNWIKKSKIGKLVFIDCSLGRMELKEKSDTDETS